MPGEAFDESALSSDLRALSRPLRTSADLAPLVERARERRLVAIGEASHGTHEFYAWRAELTRQLILECGYTWIGVEGDWPDCWRIDRWVRCLQNEKLDARAMLAGFERWPTWMWANTDVADFLDWLREINRGRAANHRVGFYGLDVYSLWDSLHRIMDWLGQNAPEALPAAQRAWRCFAPFDEDPQEYAWSTRLVPMSCETPVVDLLVEVRKHARHAVASDFDAVQNAAIVKGAEEYYRAMVRSDRSSWNIRDVHMADTVERIGKYLGERSRGVLWAHNTHVGDARATSMASQGLLNLGQLVRERSGNDTVLLVGLGTHHGSVMAATRWGAPEIVMPVAMARDGSHEHRLHTAIGHDALLDFGDDRSRPSLQVRSGHRAIGVVFDPAREEANYVPTTLGLRYDGFLWIEETTALTPLRHEPAPSDREFETEPTGM